MKTSFLDDMAFTTTSVADKTAEQMKSAVMETFACKGKYEKLKADYELMNLHCHCDMPQRNHNKTREMVDVKHKQCLCGKRRGTFAEAGGKAVRCKQCKTSEMVNVKDKSSLCGKVRCAFGEAGGEFACCYVFSMLFW